VVAHRDGTSSWRGLVGTNRVTLGSDHVYATDGASVSAYPVDGGRSTCGPSPDLPFACPVWRTPVEGASSDPVLGHGGATVYVTTDGDSAGPAMVYALATATGRVRWSVELDARDAATPALADGRLYVPADGRIVAVSADGCGAPTCRPLWSGHVGLSMSQQPTVAGGVVFVAGYDALSGYVYAFDADGCGDSICSRLWSTWVRNEITTPPVVSGGRLFIGSRWGINTYGLPASAGR
jgi:outer membrane protein assembly factor BamB